MSDPLRARALTLGEEASLEALYAAVYGVGWRERTCTERYLGEDLLAGASVSVIEAGGALLGAQPAYDVPLWVAGAERMVTMLVDVATHPDHRRRGIFSRVVDHAVALATERGAHLVLTTPNSASYRGFRKKADWALLATLECRVRVVGSRRLLREHLRLPAWVSAAFAEPVRYLLHGSGRVDGVRRTAGSLGWPTDAAVNGLWASASPPNGVMQRRDAAWFHWRFRNPPSGVEYRCITETCGGQLLGYAIVRTKQIRGAPVAFLVDAFCEERANEVSRRLLDAAAGWASDVGTSLVVFFTVPRSAWSLSSAAAGYKRFPSVLTGRSYPVCASSGSPAGERKTLLDGRRWRMSMADSDLA